MVGCRLFIIPFSQKLGKAFHQAQILESCSGISCLYIAQNTVTFSLKQITVASGKQGRLVVIFYLQLLLGLVVVC